jgi:hypothetical protein
VGKAATLTACTAYSRLPDADTIRGFRVSRQTISKLASFLSGDSQNLTWVQGGDGRREEEVGKEGEGSSELAGLGINFQIFDIFFVRCNLYIL